MPFIIKFALLIENHVQKRFDTILDGKDFFLGPNIVSYADLALYNVLTVADRSVIDPETYLTDNFPNVKRHFDAVEAYPPIKAYISSTMRRPAFIPFTY
jgi:glutathione S-transferase